MTSTGRSHGAITVINAMPCGIGATIGTDLWTEARFSVAGNGRTVNIMNDAGEDRAMAEICVRKAFELAGEEEPEGWSLNIVSEIPISRGLKSSSAACNAIIRAVLSELDHGAETLEIIRLGVECAKEAGVTVTGSFDDACGCGLGGFVMTDNTMNEIISRRDIGEYDVIIHVPAFKIRKIGLPLNELRAAAPGIREAIDIASDEPFRAMTMNGRLVSKASGVDNSLAEKALTLGALGAGMSGSGPAVAIVVGKGEGKGFAKELETDPKETIITVTRCGE